MSTSAPRRRVLLALEAGPLPTAGLELAARLARDLQAELEGIFVEDLDLLRCAELPFVRQVSRLTAASEDLLPADLERALARGAALARASLALQAERLSVRWSFRVVRERLTRALESDEPPDVTVLSTAGRTLGALPTREAALVLLLPASGGPSLEPALELALRLTEEARAGLKVVLVERQPGEGAGLAQQLELRLQALGPRASVRCAPPDVEALARLLWEARAAPLVLGGALPGLALEDLLRLARGLVLLPRPPR